jgi:hypothetical protein
MMLLQQIQLIGRDAIRMLHLVKVTNRDCEMAPGMEGALPVIFLLNCEYKIQCFWTR